MAYKTVILEKEEDIAVLTLNRPETLNAWNDQLALDASAAVEEVEQDEAMRALIITGSGRGFSSGFDVASLVEKTNKSSFSEVFSEITGKPNIASLTAKLRVLDIPVIAAVNGMAAAGGLSFALGCDLRIAAESARFSMAFIRRGLVADGGSTFLFPRAVGTGYACELMFTGDVIDADTALRIGIVNRVVPDSELMPVARELAKRIAKNSQVALKFTKRLIYEGLDETDLDAHIVREVNCNESVVQTPEFREGMALFLKKSEPKSS